MISEARSRLVAVTSLRTLICAPPEVPLREVGDTTIYKVTPDADRDTVINTMHRYSLMALPVVEAHGTMVGIITINDVLDMVLPERG